MTIAPLDELVDAVANRGGTRADCRALAARGVDAIAVIEPYLTTGWASPVTPASVLRMIRGPGTVPALVELARARKGDVRNAAIQTLGHQRDPEALARLLELLGERRTAEAAAEALGRYGDRAAIAPLRAELARRLGDDGRVRIDGWLAAGETLEVYGVIEIARAIARLGDDAPELLFWIASCPSAELRREAVRGLARAPSAAATRLLVAAQRDPSRDLAIDGLRAVAGLGLVAAVPAWLELTEQHRDLDRDLAVALTDLAGEEPPPLAETAPLRRWWMRVSARLPHDRCVWLGTPATPANAVERLSADDGWRARAALDRWTGIDFVDVAVGAGDDHDVPRARAWWKSAEATWEVGALYRAGRKHDLAPILAALRAP